MIMIENETQLDFNDVLIAPRPSSVNSRSEVDITRDYTFKWSGKTVKGCGVIAANMATMGTFEMAKVFQQHRMFCALHKHYTMDQLIRFLEENKKEFGNNDYIFISTGLRPDDFSKLKTVMKTGLCDNICLDAPNGYITSFVQHVNRIRTTFPKCVLMAGNVVTPDLTADIIRAGADISKNGIGSGAACTTRKQTGVGRPQFSTIIDCIGSAKNYGGMLCSDGGITCSGDVAKAFGAYSDFVMIGGYIAGSTEASGDIIEKVYKTNEYRIDDYDTSVYGSDLEPVFETKKFKKFYGMSSKLAQETHYDGMKEYRTSEGREKLIPYTGDVNEKICEIEGGLRSACTYVGAKSLTEFPKKVTFYKVNRQLNEVFAHCRDI